jgi:hypothetical protein
MFGGDIQKITGGIQSFNFVEAIEYVLVFESNIAAQNQWSDNSIGLLIAPNNGWQAVLYLPPRMLLYLAAPLPNVAVSVTELISGNWSEWQNLMSMATSAIMLTGLPFVLAGSAQALRFRQIQPAPLVLHITFWIAFIAVAGGNIIIHERYRVMFTLLLFACMWFGYTRCSRHEVNRWALLWFMILIAAATFYLGYKFIV